MPRQRRPHTLALNPAAVDVDVVQFEHRIGENTTEALERAAALYQGDLLEGLSVDEAPFEEWLLSERERLRELAIDALAKLVAHQSNAGELDRAIQSALRMLGFDPLQEVAHRALMKLYARQGRRDAALKQYQVCVSVLRREVNTDPEPETKNLYQEILRNRSTAVSVKTAPTTDVSGVTNPRVAIPFGDDTPLIGRDREYAELRRMLDDAEAGRGRVVAIVGEAGIGKSRLLAELATAATERRMHVLVGRCYESEQILPFGPWVDAIRSGRDSGDDTVLSELEPAVRAQLARLVPELSAPGIPPPSDDALRLFESVEQLVRRLAADRPVVVLLEDVHWADEMSVKLFAFVARRIAAAPVCIVATAREEDLGSASPLRRIFDELGRVPHFATFVLPALSEADTNALVRSLARVGSGDAALARLATRVWTTSEGNPFVVVEAMRTFGDESAPALSQTLALPDRVRQLITARLERLGDAARQLVAVAAVIGRPFDFALLRQAAALGEREAAEGLEELVRRRLLHGVGDGFDFLHERIREASYTELLPPRRKITHARVGEAIEMVHGDRLGEVSDRLAYHFSEAENSSKAAEYLARVADSAAKAYAHEDAVAVLRRALEHVRRLSPEERDRRLPDVVLGIAHSMYFFGQYKEALDLLLEHRHLVERLANAALAGRFHFVVGRYYSLLGDRRLATEHSRRALDHATRSGDVATVGRAHFVLSLEGLFAGRFREGLEHGRAATRLLEERDEPWWAGNASWITGLNDALLGNFEAGLEAERRTDAIGRLIGDDYLMCCAAWTSGWMLAARGDWEVGLESARRALERSRDHFNRSRALSILGFAYIEGGHPGEAIPILDQALQSVAPAGARALQGWFMAWLADAHRQDGDFARARQRALQALEITTAVEFPIGIATARVLSDAWSSRVTTSRAPSESSRRHSTPSRRSRPRSRRRAHGWTSPRSRARARTRGWHSIICAKPGVPLRHSTS